MDHIINFILLALLTSIAIGIAVALLPVIAFVAGFVGMILLISFLARLVAGFFF